MQHPEPPQNRSSTARISHQTLASFDADPRRYRSRDDDRQGEAPAARVQTLTEDEAAETLRLLDQRADPVLVAFRDAPLDDEPWTEEDEQAAAEGRADLAAGRTVSLDEAMRELG